MSAFPHLAVFIGAWFHQDFTIDGDVPDVVAKFRQAASSDEIAAVRGDIHGFLARSDGDANVAFDRTFDPDITPSGWDMTAREWLQWVDRLLAG